MKSLRSLATAGALGAVATVGLITNPATANVTEQNAYVYNESRCDKATGQWIAIYNVRNQGTLNAMFAVTPQSTAPITWPAGSATAPGQASAAEQRLPVGVAWETVTVTAVWSDGTLKTYSWRYSNPMRCTKG